MTAFGHLSRIKRSIKIASGFGLPLICISILTLSACFGPTHTDIDFIGETYVKKRAGFEYIRNCSKPKAFKGLGKFRVSCIQSTTNDAWDNSFGRSHASFIHYLNQKGFNYIGSSEHPNKPIKEKNPNLPIAIYAKQIERIDSKKCERRLYIDISNLMKFEITNIPLGTQLVLADDQTLHCMRTD